jgi:hypothetical protein
MLRAEDLRVDGTGTAHPVGRRAGQELRARAGDWRLVSSPPEVILALRATEGRRALRLAGEVRTPGALCDVLATMAQGGWGGELVVFEEPEAAATPIAGTTVIERSIFFEGGNVVGATSTAPGERLGEILWRFGAITQEELDRIVQASVASGRRMGEAAIELEFVGPDELFHMMTRQVEEVFYAAALVGRATFFLFDGFDPGRLARRHLLSAGALLMEAARRTDELRFFREKIPSDSWVPAPLVASGGKKPPPELEGVLSECDGRRSVAEIGRRIGQLEFEVTRSVFQLCAAGLVSVQPPRPAGLSAAVDAFNRAIVAIHAACDEASKGSELRAGVEQFATSAGAYVPVFAGAGPRPDGSVRPDVVARNVASAGLDAEGWLAQQLLEYAGFALFHAGTLLSREAAAALEGRTAEPLQLLRRSAEAALPLSLRQSTGSHGIPSSSAGSSRSASGRDT